MALTFRAIATATTGGAAAASLTIAKPAGAATGDCLICVMAVSTAANFLYSIPPGWGLIHSRRSTSLAITLLTFARQVRAADSGIASWTWTFDSARNACGSISDYYDTTALTFVRVCSITEQATASSVTHATPAITSNVASQFHLVIYAAEQQDTWTHDAAYTERDDTTTTSGAADLCVTIGELALAGTGTVAAVSATLDSAVAAGGATASLLVTSMGLSQASGSLTNFTIHNNTKSANATYFNLAEMQLSYPADIKVANHLTHARRGYVFESLGTQGLSLGSTSSPTATTWYERGATLIANSRSLATSATNLSLWTIDWQRVTLTLVASNSAFFRGNLSLIDCNFITEAGLTIANGASGLTGIVRQCTFNKAAGAGALTFGSSAFPIAEVSDVTIESETTASVEICNGMFATTCKNITIRGTGTFRAFLGVNTANAFDIDGLVLVGTPATACVRWIGASSTGWKLRNVTWPTSATKFSVASSGNPALANATLEYSDFNVKVANASGAGIANIPVKLTDVLGNVQVDTTTDANGRISFGSGQGLNSVIVMDHYAVTTVYTQRYRGPFLFEYNTGNSRNTDYQSRRGYAHWPGYETVTTTSGSFSAINDIVHLQDAAGGATSWQEREMP